MVCDIMKKTKPKLIVMILLVLVFTSTLNIGSVSADDTMDTEDPIIHDIMYEEILQEGISFIDPMEVDLFTNGVPSQMTSRYSMMLDAEYEEITITYEARPDIGYMFSYVAVNPMMEGFSLFQEEPPAGVLPNDDWTRYSQTIRAVDYMEGMDFFPMGTMLDFYAMNIDGGSGFLRNMGYIVGGNLAVAIMVSDNIGVQFVDMNIMDYSIQPDPTVAHVRANLVDSTPEYDVYIAEYNGLTQGFYDIQILVGDMNGNMAFDFRPLMVEPSANTMPPVINDVVFGFGGYVNDYEGLLLKLLMQKW